MPINIEITSIPPNFEAIKDKINFPPTFTDDLDDLYFDFDLLQTTVRVGKNSESVEYTNYFIYALPSFVDLEKDEVTVLYKLPSFAKEDGENSIRFEGLIME